MLSVLVPRYVYAVAVMLHGQALPQELAAKACLCRLEVQHEEAGSELLQQHQEVPLEAGRSSTTTWLWVADGMLTTIADATLTVTLAVTPQKAVPFASVGDNQLHAEQQGGTKVTKTGVKCQPGMAAAVARPASAGEAGTGQKGLFSWCRKLAKRRQVASGGQEEQDNGTKQAPPSLAGKPGAGGRAASPQQPPEGKEVAGSLQRQVLQDSISLQEVLMSATLERSFELNPEGGGCLGVTVKIGAPQRGPHHLVLQRNHPGTVVVDHNLDDLVTLLPLPAKMARRTPRQSRSTHDVLHAPARVVPGAADQAPTPGLHEGLPAQHKRTGLDTMVSGAGGLGAVLEHEPAYVTFGGVQDSKAGKHVPHMPVAAARHAVPESGTGQHLPLQPQSSSSRSADAVPAAGEADGLKRISFELQQPQPQQLDGLLPESSTIAQEPPAPAEQHRRSPPSLEGGPRHQAGRLSSQGSPPAVKYARLLNGVLEPDHETLQPDRKSMSLQQGMDRRQFRPLSGSAAPPSCPVTPGIHATRNFTGAAVGDGRLHSALPSRRTSADVEHAAVVRGRLGNMSLAAGMDRQQLQLAFRGLSGLDRKLLLPAHKRLAEDSFGQELGGRLDRLSASMTMPNRPSPAGHLSRQTSWSKDDTGLDVKRRASTLRPAVPSAEDPVTGQPCLDFELRLSDEATCSGPALARCSQGDGGTVVISCWQDASWMIWAMLQRPADDIGVQHTAVLMQDEAVGHWTCKQVQGSLAAGSSRPGPALVWQWVAPGTTGKHAVSTADAQGSAAALLGHRGAQLPEAGAQGGGRPSWLGSLCRRAGPDTVSDPSSSGTAGAAQAKAAPAHPPPRQGPLAQLGVWPAEMRHPTTESRRESRASRRPTSSRRQSGTGGDPFLRHALSGDRMLSRGGMGGSGKLRPSDGRVTDQLSEADGMQQPCELTVEFEEAVSAQAAGIVCLGYALLAMAHEEGTPSLRITTSQSASKLSEALNIHPDHEGSNGTPS